MKGTEAEYIIPLRKEVRKVPKYDRTKKAVRAVRAFLEHHTKSENVWLGSELNRKLQENGRKNVVPRIHVDVVKDEETYKAELHGFPIELEKERKAREEAKKKGKPIQEKKVDVKEEKKEAANIVETTTPKEPAKEVPAPQKKTTKKVAEKQRHESIVAKAEKPTNEKKK